MTIKTHSTVAELAGIKRYSQEEDKQRDSSLFLSSEEESFSPHPGGIFLFLSVDNHLTPRIVKCLEMKNFLTCKWVCALKGLTI